MLRFGPSELSTVEPRPRTGDRHHEPALTPLPGRLARWEAMLFGALLLAYAGLVLGLGLGRSHLGYGVETDFIGGYVPEAQRFLDGEPLLSRFHPPLYPMVIAGLRQLVGDWPLAGVMLSVVSSVAALIASWLLFHDLGGRAPAWGAVLTLLGSGAFIAIFRQRQHRCALSRAVRGQLSLRDQSAPLRVALAVARLWPIGRPRHRHAIERRDPGSPDSRAVRRAGAVALRT